VGDKPPANIGDYKILEELGRGAFGVVYLGEKNDLPGERFALKVFSNDGGRADFADALLKELSALADPAHARIVNVRDFGAAPEADPPSVYAAMDFIEGPDGKSYDLGDHVRAHGGKLPEPEVKRIFRQIADGLREIHNLGFVHLDLKPQNVILDSNLNVRLTDYGVCQAVGCVSIEETGKVEWRGLATEYASPEQLDQCIGDAGSDIYSLGVMLLECLTGNRPEVDRSGEGASIKYTPPSAAGLDARWDEIVAGCLEADPGDRFARADEFLEAVEEIDDSDGLGAVSLGATGNKSGRKEPQTGEDGGRGSRSRKIAIGLGVLFLVAAVSAGSVYYLGWLPTGENGDVTIDAAPSIWELETYEAMESEPAPTEESDAEITFEDPFALFSDEEALDSLFDDTNASPSRESGNLFDPATEDLAVPDMGPATVTEADPEPTSSPTEKVSSLETEIVALPSSTPLPRMTSTTIPTRTALPTAANSRTPTNTASITPTGTVTHTATSRATTTPTPLPEGYAEALLAEKEAKAARRTARGIQADSIYSEEYKAGEAAHEEGKSALDAGEVAKATNLFNQSNASYQLAKEMAEHRRVKEQERIELSGILNSARKKAEEGEQTAAEREYEKYLTRSPEEASVSLEYAELLLQTGNSRRGIERLRKTARLPDLGDSERARIHANFGVLFRKGGNVAAAVKQMQKALRFEPDGKRYKDLLLQYEFELAERARLEED